MVKTVVHYLGGPYLPITQNWVYGQIKNMERYQPIVYCWSEQNLDVFPTQKVRCLGLTRRTGDPWTFFNAAWNKVFGFYPSLAFFLLRDKPRLVHAHFGPSGYSFLQLKKTFKIPLITTFYGYDVSLIPSRDSKWKIRYEELFAVGEIFLVEGEHMKESLIELGCRREKIVVQHLGVDLDRIKFVPRELGLDEEIRVLICASFREKKGITYAVEAFGKIKQAHPKLKLKLTIIGDSTGSPEEEKEKAKILGTITKYHLRDSVNLLGYQPYHVFLRELYQHHIFLHPSVHASNGDSEGGVPVSLLEASASGSVVLSTTHCDIPEVITDGESGYLVPERDLSTLAERLKILACNPEVWKRLGRKGREHIEEEYDLRTQVKRLEEIYERVSEGV